jgi:uncharacterized protein YneF (UPF0154 family)
MIIKKIVKFFDKLEDKIRGKLSHYPIVYALIGGIGVVLFWRGVWHTADDFNVNSTISLVAGSVILLLTGVFVSAFIGKKLIISGLTKEEKLTEEEQKEILTEEIQIKNLQNTLKKVEEKLEHIDADIHKK